MVAARAAARSPHGAPVVQVCHGCLETSAAYPGTLPRGWRLERATGRVYCRTCRRPAAARPAVPPAPSDGG